MKVLVLYGTVEGQTAKVAGFVADQVRALGHEADLQDSDAPEPVEFGDVDAVILAGSVHQRRHPRHFEALLAGLKEDLSRRKTLLLSVSLNAAFGEGREEAQEYVTELKMRTGFEPDSEMLVAGAVRSSEYDYFAMQVIRHVVLRGRKADDSGEHEFTDWEALAAGVEKFLGKAG